jgi:hypothetical protein
MPQPQRLSYRVVSRRLPVQLVGTFDAKISMEDR